MAYATKILSFKFSVILITVNVNVQSHMWLVAPVALTGQAEGVAGQIVLFSVLGLPWGPEGVRSKIFALRI